MWTDMSTEEGQYLESFDENFNEGFSAFDEALELESCDGGGETRYDFLRDLRNGVYSK